MYSIIDIHKGEPTSISPLRRLDATHNQQELIVMSHVQYMGLLQKIQLRLRISSFSYDSSDS